MATPGEPIEYTESSRDDQVLVRECLHGSEAAWAVLMDKYKNLIFSIPIKMGMSRDDANDIFQNACLALLSELPGLREPRALASWLIRTTSHLCSRRIHEQFRYVDGAEPEEEIRLSSPMPEQLLLGVEREQIVREAVAELPTSCRQLVELLFYRSPPLNYDEIAATLQLPKGGIGPTRMRCIGRLRRILETKGFC